MNTLELVSKLSLVILSAYLIKRTSSPPLRTTTLPAYGSSFSEKREWLFIRATLYLGPYFRLGYTIITIFECLFIITRDAPASPIPGILVRYLPVERLPLPMNTSQRPGYIAELGLLVGILGGLLRVTCYTYLGKAFTFNITTKSTKLVTSGPYSLVRHPSYLGSWLINVGVAVYHLSPGSWLRESGTLDYIVWRVAVGLWVLVRVLLVNISMTLRTEEEDQLMKTMFGEEWEAWRKVVRYRIFPGLY